MRNEKEKEIKMLIVILTLISFILFADKANASTRVSATNRVRLFHPSFPNKISKAVLNEKEIDQLIDIKNRLRSSSLGLSNNSEKLSRLPWYEIISEIRSNTIYLLSYIINYYTVYHYNFTTNSYVIIFVT